jgi:hypothetical protein
MSARYPRSDRFGRDGREGRDFRDGREGRDFRDGRDGRDGRDFRDGRDRERERDRFARERRSSGAAMNVDDRSVPSSMVVVAESKPKYEVDREKVCFDRSLPLVEYQVDLIPTCLSVSPALVYVICVVV